MQYINFIEYYLPDRVNSNEDIQRDFPQFEIARIAEAVGIKNRHQSGENEFSSDMAIRAANKLFTINDIDKSTIDFVLLCTQTPDYFLPATSCIIQNALGLSTSCGAFDFNLGCSGYVYGLGIAKSLLQAGLAKNILFLTTDVFSKIVGKEDKSNRVLLGDSASASLISNQEKGFLLMDFVLGTDGAGAENLIVKEGAMRHRTPSNILRTDEYGNKWMDSNVYMNGTEVFTFSLRVVPKLVTDVLLKNNLTMPDIEYFIFHQANKFMLEHLRKKIGIDKHKFVLQMEDSGNTGPSTIPIALKKTWSEYDIPPGADILLAGFGVGLSWAGTVIKSV